MIGNHNPNDTTTSYNKRGLTNMEAFDKLPKTAREALRNSDHNWSAAQLYDAHKSRRIASVRKAADIPQFLKQQDANKHARDADAGVVCGGQR